MKISRKRIMYGFQGDGRGHLSRADALVREIAKHHDVLVFTTKKGNDNLSQEFRDLPGVTVSGNIFSPRLYFSKDRISLTKTVLLGTVDIIREWLPSWMKALVVYLKYKPDLIISDLEPFTAWLAWITGKRFMSFDHQHVLTDCQIEYPREYRKDHQRAKFMVRFLVPLRRLNVITSFFSPPLRRARTRVYKPLLRKEILAAKDGVKEGDFILVYLTSSTTLDMLDRVLKVINSESFVVYNREREYTDGNIIYKSISVEGFIRDLSVCKAVLCNGGYLISEALFLGKPILSIPIVNSFDQILNSVYIEKLGYGQFSSRFSASEIFRFVADLDRFRENISQKNFYGNQEIVDFVVRYACMS